MDRPLPTVIESYDDAIRWIYGRINYEHIRPRKTSGHFRLERVQRLLALIGSPQQRIPAIHIAGTKGKGSTAAIIESVLRAAGVRTGLFTSPHIHRFEERLQVNRRMPDEACLTELVARLLAALNSADPDLVDGGPTYFEVATLLAWMYFDDCRIQLAVLETGLGGRLDCTNVCQPLVTAITSIGLDHTHILGDTLELIAAEKAGILKAGVPVVCGARQPSVIEVIESRAAELGCDFQLLDRDFSFTSLPPGSPDLQRLTVHTRYGDFCDLTLPLTGAHQLRNAALAVAAAAELAASDSRITAGSVHAGVAATSWPLRFEVVNQQPLLVLDAAHNPDAIEALVRTLQEPRWQQRRQVLLFAVSKDKDAAGMLQQAIPQFQHIVLTRFETNPRSTATDVLSRLAQEVATDDIRSRISRVDQPEAALQQARQQAGPDGLVCVSGSIFLAAEIRDMLVRTGQLT